MNESKKKMFIFRFHLFWLIIELFSLSLPYEKRFIFETRLKLSFDVDLMGSVDCSKLFQVVPGCSRLSWINMEHFNVCFINDINTFRVFFIVISTIYFILIPLLYVFQVVPGWWPKNSNFFQFCLNFLSQQLTSNDRV